MVTGMKRYIVGISGASGSMLAKRALEIMSELEVEINIIVAEKAADVYEYENEEKIEDFFERISENNAKIVVHDKENAIGTILEDKDKYDGAVIIPCSINTIAEAVDDDGDTLMRRALNVCHKKRIPLVVVPREAPANSEYLKNLLKLTEDDVKVIIPTPTSYSKNVTFEGAVNSIVAKVLKGVGIDVNIKKGA